MTLPLESQALLDRIEQHARDRDSGKLVLSLQAAIAEDHQELFDELMKRSAVADTAFILEHVDVEETDGGWLVSIKGESS